MLSSYRRNYYNVSWRKQYQSFYQICVYDIISVRALLPGNTDREKVFNRFLKPTLHGWYPRGVIAIIRVEIRNALDQKRVHVKMFENEPSGHTHAEQLVLTKLQDLFSSFENSSIFNINLYLVSRIVNIF